MRFIFLLLCIVSKHTYADVTVFGDYLQYSSDKSVAYTFASNLEVESNLAVGDVLEVNIHDGLSIRALDFKESFMPVEKLPNLPKVISYSLPSYITPAAIYHIRYGSDPFCELMLLDSKMSSIANKAKEKFFNTLKRQKINLIQKSGYISASCKVGK
jgi:hypothetical protein